MREFGLWRLGAPALILLAGAALAGCVETAVGGAAVVGTTAMQDRGIKGATTDTAIRAEINHYWLEKDHKMSMALKLHVHEGPGLVSGAVATPHHRTAPLQPAWTASRRKYS